MVEGMGYTVRPLLLLYRTLHPRTDHSTHRLHAPLASMPHASPTPHSTIQPARDKPRDLKSPNEPSDANWSLSSLDDFPRVQELPACSYTSRALPCA